MLVQMFVSAAFLESDFEAREISVCTLHFDSHPLRSPTMPAPPSVASGSAGPLPRPAVYQCALPLGEDYSIDLQCRVSDRSVQTYEPFPMFLVNAETYAKGKGLPKTNLEPLTKPTGLSMRDEILWDLAQLLEGKQGVYHVTPQNFDFQGSTLQATSRYLSWCLRHSTDLTLSRDNWLDLGEMIDHNKQKLNSAEIIFMAVMANPKQRFEFSRPVYLPYASKRESRVSGQTSYIPSILIRARQGHTASSSPTAGMVKLDETNLPVVALHGTSVAAMKGIMKHGLTPGGETAENRGTGRQAVHLAATLPASDAEVVSGYRQGSQVCINVDLAAFMENGGEVWQSANFVLNIFTTIRPAFFLCAIDTTNGWDYVTGADANALWVAKLNPVFTSTFRARQEEQSISRERVSFLSPDDLPESLVSLKQEAENTEEGDRDFIEPVSRPKRRVHFDDDEPEPAMSGKTAENIRTVLESALGQNLDDLKTTTRDPSDVQQGLDQAAAKAELEAKSRVSELPP